MKFFFNFSFQKRPRRGRESGACHETWRSDRQEIVKLKTNVNLKTKKRWRGAAEKAGGEEERVQGENGRKG